MPTSDTENNSKNKNEESTENNSASGYENEDVNTNGETNDDSSDSEQDDNSFGYEDDSNDSSDDSSGDDKDSKKADDDKTLDDKTGYTDTIEDESKDDENSEEDSKKDDDKNEDDKSETDEEKAKKAAEKLKADIKESVNLLPDSVDKEKLEQFALDNNFTKEQVDAYVKLAAGDIAANQEAAKAAKLTQRKQWQKELKEDPTFGGEKFNENIHKVNRALEDHFPNLNKVLTERGSMVPPYIMKDILGFADSLDPKTEFVIGDRIETTKEDNVLDEMYPDS